MGKIQRSVLAGQQPEPYPVPRADAVIGNGDPEIGDGTDSLVGWVSLVCREGDLTQLNLILNRVLPADQKNIPFAVVIGPQVSGGARTERNNKGGSENPLA